MSYGNVGFFAYSLTQFLTWGLFLFQCGNFEMAYFF